MENKSVTPKDNNGRRGMTDKVTPGFGGENKNHIILFSNLLQYNFKDQYYTNVMC